MNNAAILAKENCDLQTANKKQKQKQKQSTNQLLYREGLSVQKAQELI